MKHNNRIIAERIYYNCNETDVMRLMQYWDVNNEGYIDMKMEAEINEYGYPNGTYQIIFSFSVSSCEDRYFHNIEENANEEMALFLEKLDKGLA